MKGLLYVWFLYPYACGHEPEWWRVVEHEVRAQVTTLRMHAPMTTRARVLKLLFIRVGVKSVRH